MIQKLADNELHHLLVREKVQELIDITNKLQKFANQVAFENGHLAWPFPNVVDKNLSCKLGVSEIKLKTTGLTFEEAYEYFKKGVAIKRPGFSNWVTPGMGQLIDIENVKANDWQVRE